MPCLLGPAAARGTPPMTALEWRAVPHVYGTEGFEIRRYKTKSGKARLRFPAIGPRRGSPGGVVVGSVGGGDFCAAAAGVALPDLVVSRKRYLFREM